MLFDVTFLGHCLYLQTHFQILRETINNTEMKEFVDIHRQVINLTQAVRNFYKRLIFMKFTLIAVILCAACFQVSSNDDFEKKLRALSHVIVASLELLIYSYGGQKIMDSSMSVCDDVYEIDKNYLFIMMRSQMAVEMKSGFFHACLPIYMILIKRTMSLITLLKSLNSK